MGETLDVQQGSLALMILLSGAIFVMVARIIRRPYRPWALLAVTAVGIGLAALANPYSIPTVWRLAERLDTQQGTLALALLVLLSAAIFATVATIVRRRYGAWALLAVTAVAIAPVVLLLANLFVLQALLLAPVVPGLATAAVVVEWRVRRAVRSHVWHHVAWGTVAFVLGAVAGVVVVSVGFRGTALP